MSRYSPREIERWKRIAAKMHVEIPAKGSLAEPAGSEPTAEELAQLTDTMWRMDPVQLAAVSGAALGLAERKARHTVIPSDHWLLRHMPPNTKPSGGGPDHE